MTSPSQPVGMTELCVSQARGARTDSTGTIGNGYVRLVCVDRSIVCDA